jgi:hypothetical protein
MIPKGCVKPDDLHSLARALNRLKAFHSKHGGASKDDPCLRLIQGSRNGRITALVESGGMMLKMALKDGEWIALGDALKALDD